MNIHLTGAVLILRAQKFFKSQALIPGQFQLNFLFNFETFYCRAVFGKIIERTIFHSTGFLVAMLRLRKRFVSVGTPALKTSII